MAVWPKHQRTVKRVTRWRDQDLDRGSQERRGWNSVFRQRASSKLLYVPAHQSRPNSVGREATCETVLEGTRPSSWYRGPRSLRPAHRDREDSHPGPHCVGAKEGCCEDDRLEHRRPGVHRHGEGRVYYLSRIARDKNAITWNSGTTRRLFIASRQSCHHRESALVVHRELIFAVLVISNSGSRLMAIRRRLAMPCGGDRTRGAADSSR